MFQTKFDAMKKQMDAQEMELMETRLMKTSELNGEMDEDEDSGNRNCLWSTKVILWVALKALFSNTAMPFKHLFKIPQSNIPFDFRSSLAEPL